MLDGNLSGWLLASHVVLWILFLINVTVTVGLLRQVGILSIRIHPFGARMTDDGLNIGEMFPDIELFEDGKESIKVVHAGAEGAKPQMLVFLTPGCPTCHRLISGVRGLLPETSEKLDWFVISLGERQETESFRAAHKLNGEVPFFRAGRKTGDDLRIRMVPFAFLLDRDGSVKTKGVVNHIEHLESIVSQIDHSTSPTPGGTDENS